MHILRKQEDVLLSEAAADADGLEGISIHQVARGERTYGHPSAKITTRFNPNPTIRIGIPGSLRLSQTNATKTIKDADKLVAASQSGSR